MTKQNLMFLLVLSVASFLAYGYQNCSDANVRLMTLNNTAVSTTVSEDLNTGTTTTLMSPSTTVAAVPTDCRIMKSSFGFTYFSNGFSQGSYALEFIVPASFTSTGRGSISLVEYPQPVVERTVSLSEIPCDFNKSTVLSLGSEVEPSITYGGLNCSRCVSIPILKSGGKYYYNFTNKDAAGNPSCVGLICDVKVQMTIPR